MPLVSLKDFPGAATAKYSNLTRPIADRLMFLQDQQANVDESMRREGVVRDERMRVEKRQDDILARKEAVAQRGLRFLEVLNIKDNYPDTLEGKRMATAAQKKALAQWAQEEGGDSSFFDEAFGMDSDNLNLWLTKGVNKASAGLDAAAELARRIDGDDPIKLGKGDRLIDSKTHEELVGAAPSMPGYTFQKAYPVGDGMVQAAHVPDDPNGEPIFHQDRNSFRPRNCRRYRKKQIRL